MRRSPIPVVAFAALLLAQPAAGQTVNLVSNGDFELNVVGWTPEQAYMSIEHAMDDVDDDEESGSARVRFNPDLTLDMSGQVFQCVPVTGGEDYTVLASVFIPSGQMRTGAIGLRVAWFQSSDCSSFPTKTDFGASTTTEDAWIDLTPVDLTAPGPAQSAEVQLSIGKTAAGGTRSANFDDVQLLPEPGATVRALSALAALLLLARLARARGPGSHSRGGP